MIYLVRSKLNRYISYLSNKETKSYANKMIRREYMTVFSSTHTGKKKIYMKTLSTIITMTTLALV